MKTIEQLLKEDWSLWYPPDNDDIGYKNQKLQPKKIAIQMCKDIRTQLNSIGDDFFKKIKLSYTTYDDKWFQPSQSYITITVKREPQELVFKITCRGAVTLLSSKNTNIKVQIQHFRNVKYAVEKIVNHIKQMPQSHVQLHSKNLLVVNQKNEKIIKQYLKNNIKNGILSSSRYDGRNDIYHINVEYKPRQRDNETYDLYFQLHNGELILKQIYYGDEKHSPRFDKFTPKRVANEKYLCKYINDYITIIQNQEFGY